MTTRSPPVELDEQAECALRQWQELVEEEDSQEEEETLSTDTETLGEKTITTESW